MNQNIRHGVTCAAVGCVFLYFNISIQSINLLPSFVGYLLFLQACRTLKAENRDFALLIPLGVLLAGWYLAHWLLEMFGFSMEGDLYVLEALITVVNLYFCFQFYTDLAKLAQQMQKDNLAGSICRCRNILTVTTTIMALPLNLFLEEEPILWILTPVLVIGLAAALVLTVKLFLLKKLAAGMADESRRE